MLARTAQDLGLLIRDQRRQLGLEQRELAERAGVSRQWIVEVEKGKPRAQIDLILRTLKVLGLSVEIRTDGNASDRPKVARTPIKLDDVIARARSKKP